MQTFVQLRRQTDKSANGSMHGQEALLQHVMPSHATAARAAAEQQVMLQEACVCMCGTLHLLFFSHVLFTCMMLAAISFPPMPRHALNDPRQTNICKSDQTVLITAAYLNWPHRAWCSFLVIEQLPEMLPHCSHKGKQMF